MLRSLTDVGPSKPIGYLPLYTIEEFLRSSPETLAAVAATRGCATAQFAQATCCIRPSRPEAAILASSKNR